MDISLAGKAASNRKEKEEILERMRDVCMTAESGMRFRITLAIEEQTDVHYYMPVRAMFMDAMYYENQCRKKAAEAMERGEKLSPVQGVVQGTKILPVMTIVLYLGRKEWDGPRQLYDMFDFPEEESDVLKRLVADYPMHLIDACHMSDDELECFTDDLRIFFTALRDNYDENKIKRCIAKYPDTWYTLAIIKNDERYIEHMQTLQKMQDREGGIRVDATLERIENRGFQRGISQGIGQGISQGISQGINQGIDLVLELGRRLQAEGRDEELKHSFEDKAYLQELLEEHGLIAGKNPY